MSHASFYRGFAIIYDGKKYHAKDGLLIISSSDLSDLYKLIDWSANQDEYERKLQEETSE